MVETSGLVKLWEFYFPQALILLGVLLAYMQMRRDRAKEIKDEEGRHQQNIARLDSLKDFQAMQVQLNQSRGDEMTELKIQTSRITAVLEGQNRRMEMLEDR